VDCVLDGRAIVVPPSPGPSCYSACAVHDEAHRLVTRAPEYPIGRARDAGLSGRSAGAPRPGGPLVSLGKQPLVRAAARAESGDGTLGSAR
jgi:hypothetical protein